MRRYIAALFLLTLCLVFVTGGKAEETAEEGRQQFAQKAADALDNTLLQIKNGFSNFIEDSAKLTNFFNNVTDRFKKLTQSELDKADKV